MFLPDIEIVLGMENTWTHLAAMYNVLFMIMMSWMSSLCRWVLFLPGLWPTNAGYCFVSAKRGPKLVSTCSTCTLITVMITAGICNLCILQLLIKSLMRSTQKTHNNCCLISCWNHKLQAKKMCCHLQCNHSIVSGLGWKGLNTVC